MPDPSGSGTLGPAPGGPWSGTNIIMTSITSRKLKTTIAFVCSSFLVAIPAFAISLGDYSGLGSSAGAAGLRTNADLSVVIGRVIGALIGLLGIVFVVLLVYGGFIWMTAQGNEDKIKKAKSVITSAVVGLVVVFAAYAIASAVIEALSSATTEAPAATPATPPPGP
ncbi:MAG TPA: pilin [Candidatus Binatia bacterium]|nr:pilin [Candidatus Binatia bacterium]